MSWVFLGIGQVSNGMKPLPRCSKCAFSKGKNYFCTSDKNLLPCLQCARRKNTSFLKTSRLTVILVCSSKCLCDVWANGAEVPDINTLQGHENRDCPIIGNSNFANSSTCLLQLDGSSGEKMGGILWGTCEGTFICSLGISSLHFTSCFTGIDAASEWLSR